MSASSKFIKQQLLELGRERVSTPDEVSHLAEDQINRLLGYGRECEAVTNKLILQTPNNKFVMDPAANGVEVKGTQPLSNVLNDIKKLQTEPRGASQKPFSPGGVYFIPLMESVRGKKHWTVIKIHRDQAWIIDPKGQGLSQNKRRTKAILKKAGFKNVSIVRAHVQPKRNKTLSGRVAAQLIADEAMYGANDWTTKFSRSDKEKIKERVVAQADAIVDEKARGPS